MYVWARCQALGAFAQPRHHYRPVSRADSRVSPPGMPGTRWVVDDVHLVIQFLFLPRLPTLPPSRRPIVVRDCRRLASLRHSPPSLEADQSYRPARLALVLSSLEKFVSPSWNRRDARRIENTSIIYRDELKLYARVPRQVLFRCKTGRTLLLPVVSVCSRLLFL